MTREHRHVLAGILMVGLLGAAVVAQGPKPPERTPEEQKSAAEALKFAYEGVQLRQQGKPAEAVAKLRQSLEAYQRAYPKSKYPDGHLDLARSLGNLGGMLKAAGSAEKGLPFLEQALAMNRRLYPESRYPDGHPDLANSLNSMGFVLSAIGSAEKAVPFYEQALAMYRKLYPESKYPGGHPEIARDLNNLGFALAAAGAPEKALPFHEQALAMKRRLYPESQYPGGHLELALGLGHMGAALATVGSAEKALPYYEQALAMCRRLYPESTYPGGHPKLARSLGNMGYALQRVGSVEKALPYYEQALAMQRKLYPASKYPDGHPDLATGLNEMGLVVEAAASADKALPYYEQALAMRRRLYPASRYPGGHPDLAVSLSNMGSVLMAAESAEKALPFYEQALEMQRRLYPASKYPGGHPDLARSLANVGVVLLAAGSAERALPFYEQALAMQRTLGRRLLLASSESDALAYVQAQPPMCDAYLTATLQLARAEAAAYRAVWDSKAAVTRVLELRHAAARAGGGATAEQLFRLKELRRRIEQLLQDARRPAEERDKELARLAEERDKIERRLARDLPILERWNQRDRGTPDDLARALPTGTAFIDLRAWTRLEYDPKSKSQAGWKRIPSYLAFVVAQGGDVQRVDLGSAEPIDAAVLSWRQAIERNETSNAPEQLGTLVWGKIVKLLPPGTTTLYLSPDDNLARLPWAALPVGRGRVLLEDYALATVPHGPFLLEQLRNCPPLRTGLANESVLTLGDVAYNSATWPALPATRVELGALAALAPSAPVELTKTAATKARLSEALPKARFAHLATHGEFQADAFAAEKQRLLAARRDWQEGKTQEVRRVAAKNPLGYVGIVLADGEVMSGLSILDLDLENLKLVTLSACETGLGEYTGGKGVENLQEAFHLAGCPNVVASLWKVNDAATAALMTQFYHELWVNKKPPIEALREAQLTVYRHPERIPALAGERGRPALDAAARLGSATKPDQKPKTTPTKLWAAFVLSGAGK